MWENAVARENTSNDDMLKEDKVAETQVHIGLRDKKEKKTNKLPADPLTRAAVSITGRTYLWSLRARRRNKLHPHSDGEEPKHKHQDRHFVLFSFERIQEALENPVYALSFSVGPLFLVGSLLFVIGTSAQTHREYWTGAWSTRLEDGLVNIPFLIGAILFLLGAYAALIEASNIHFDERWHAWKNNGEQGPPPKIRSHPLPSEDSSQFVAYYGSMIQFFGAVLFMIGATTEQMGSHYDLPGAVNMSLLDVQFLVGGIFFTIGAFLLVSEGCHSWWRGYLPPLRSKELKSLDYWIGWLNWWGSLLFMGGGIEGFVNENLSVTGSQIMNSFTWLLGSILFAIQGVILYLETINHLP